MPAASRLPFPVGAMSAFRAASLAAEFGQAPPAVRPSFRVQNEAAVRPRVYVYDIIGGWDMDAAEFVQQIHDLDATDIDLHINSPGGFVYDAVAMYGALVAHPATVHTMIDGLAGSAASFLAMAGDTVEIVAGGRIMIHDAQVGAWGSPSDLREAADLADAISDDISGYYAAHAGGDPADWRAAMRAETWYSASQAVDAGLADRVIPAKKADGESAPEDRASQLIRARARVALGGVR